MPTFKPIPTLKAESFDENPSGNTAAPPVGAPENMLPSVSNDTQRYDKGSQREIYDWLEALDLGFGADHAEQTNAVSGVNTVHPVATPTVDGFLSAADKTILDGLAATGAPVTSVFSRQGVVVSAVGDYTASQVTNVPAGSIIATSVQGAIDELENEKAGDTATTTALAAKVDKTYTLTSGAGISGGGTFESALTLAMSIQDFSASGLTPQMADLDLFAFVQDGNNNHFKITRGDLLANVLGAGGFYESAQIAFNKGTAVTVNHNLGVRPKMYKAYLQCISAEHGYNIGDEQEWGTSGATQDTSNNFQTAMSTLYLPSDTQITMVVSNLHIFMASRTNAIVAELNTGAWRLVFRAWA